MAYEIEERLTLASGRFLRLEELHFTDRKGKKRKWECASRQSSGSRGAAMIVARILPEDSFVLIRQFRAPAGKLMIEFPAGLIDPGETPEETAVRELKEETGFTGKVVRSLPPAASSAGLTGELTVTVLMEIDGNALKENPPQAAPEENEEIEVFPVPRRELAAFLEAQKEQGCGVDAKLQAFVLGLEFVSAKPADA